MKVLLTGGAGYIGSHTCLNLIDQGHEVTIIDDLSTGNIELIPKKAKLCKNMLFCTLEAHFEGENYFWRNFNLREFKFELHKIIEINNHKP